VTLLGIDFPPISHLTRWPDILFEDTPFAINKTVLIYLAAVVITLAFFFAAARRAQLVPRGVQNVAESSVEFIRESVILQTIGPEGMGYLPFLTTMFFFIFIANIFEIIPFIQFPANARIAVPFLLAITVWFIFNIVGIKRQGFGGYMKSSLIPPGVPKAILPLMVLIEFVSTFFVTFAILSASIFGAAAFLKVGATFPFALLIALTAFEILVAGLQAFIFAILTAVYIGLAMHPEH